MKKIIIPILLFCIGYANAINAGETDISTIDNVIYVAASTVNAGESAKLSICMKNTAQIRGFQFNLYLPEGITAVKNSKGRIQASLSEARHDEGDEHTLSVSEQDDGSLLFLCGSLYDETFIGTEGEIGTLSISVAADTAPGDYPVLLKAMKLTETDISRFYETTELTSTLTITEKQQGVENEDEYTDISSLENAIYITKLYGLTGTTVDLNIKMKNSITVKGCSFKLTLPEGLQLQKDEDGDVVYQLSSRAKKMSLTWQDWNNGTYDFALTPSTGTATISGSDDVVVTFKLPIPEDMVEGDYALKLTKCLIQSKVDGTTTDYPLSDLVTTLTVEDYVIGDVNGDRKVTPSDAIMILYHYFDVEQTGFNVKAADVNGYGGVTPADAIEALYIYFNDGSQSNARQMQKTLDPQ